MMACLIFPRVHLVVRMSFLSQKSPCNESPIKKFLYGKGVTTEMSIVRVPAPHTIWIHIDLLYNCVALKDLKTTPEVDFTEKIRVA